MASSPGFFRRVHRWIQPHLKRLDSGISLENLNKGLSYVNDAIPIPGFDEAKYLYDNWGQHFAQAPQLASPRPTSSVAPFFSTSTTSPVSYAQRFASPLLRSIPEGPWPSSGARYLTGGTAVPHPMTGFRSGFPQRKHFTTKVWAGQVNSVRDRATEFKYWDVKESLMPGTGALRAVGNWISLWEPGGAYRILPMPVRGYTVNDRIGNKITIRRVEMNLSLILSTNYVLPYMKAFWRVIFGFWHKPLTPLQLSDGYLTEGTCTPAVSTQGFRETNNEIIFDKFQPLSYRDAAMTSGDAYQVVGGGGQGDPVGFSNKFSCLCDWTRPFGGTDYGRSMSKAISMRTLNVRKNVNQVVKWDSNEHMIEGLPIFNIMYCGQPVNEELNFDGLCHIRFYYTDD